MSFPEAPLPPSPLGPPPPPRLIGVGGVLLRVVVPPFVAVLPGAALSGLGEGAAAVVTVWGITGGIAGVVLAIDAAYKLSRQLVRTSDGARGQIIALTVLLTFVFLFLQTLLAGFAFFAGCLCSGGSGHGLH